MRTKKTVIVLISGVAGVGKTELSRILSEKLLEFPSLTVEKYSFARPLKYIAENYLEWDGQKDENGRRLLQNLGRIGREYNQNVWVSKMFQWLDRKSLFPVNFCLVDDWRFKNESEFIDKNPMFQTFTVRVIGREPILKDSELSNDSSETELRDLIPDYLIDNSGTINELTIKADALIEKLKILYIVE
jgi:hypothetical protein